MLIGLYFAELYSVRGGARLWHRGGHRGDIPFTGGARIPTRDWLGTRQPEIYDHQSADKKPEQAAWAESQYPG